MAGHIVIDHAKCPLLKRKKDYLANGDGQQGYPPTCEEVIHTTNSYSLFNKTSMNFPAILIHNKILFLFVCNLAKST